MKRRPAGGRIDRSRPIRFSWDDRELVGFHGDTLASALLGAGVRVIGRSGSLDRPRGIMSAGFEEAHGFAQVGSAQASEPLVRLTTVPLTEGLVARSRIARGYLPPPPDGARCDKRHVHCDLLVVGAGPAGLAAALIGARSRGRVIVAEADFALGGSLLGADARLDGRPALEWVDRVAAELAAVPSVRVLASTTAAIALDQNGFVLVQRVGGAVEQRLWQVRARAAVLATGALERTIVFPDNDRPGVMLAGSARTYLHRFALAPERGAVFTTTDDGYRTALDWHAAGVPVAAIVDPRETTTGDLPRQARDAGLPVRLGAVVAGTVAGEDGSIRAIRVAAGGRETTVECDLLAVSGGFDPALNLHLQRRGAAGWDERRLCQVPGSPEPGQHIAGAASGEPGLAAALSDGARAAAKALGNLGLTAPAWEPPAAEAPAAGPPSPLWNVPAPDGDESRSFVDPHRDVTAADLARALGAGLRHVEHVKRYTLIGTGVEQGRVAKVTAGALTARGTGRPVADVGTSSARPPAEPILFHALAGRAKGPLFEPVRTTSIHPAHVAAGARFEPVGQWLRPRYYPRAGETMAEATLRECRAVREGVAMMDASTLGKIDVQGPDAAAFLDRLYINPIGSLAPGKARYGVMCRQDGTILDDGVVIRLEPNRFFVTTTTGNAAAVIDWMEEWLQTEWPDLAVWVTSITEQWATVAVVGPASLAVMADVAPGADWSNQAFPFLSVRRATVGGVSAQVARISFSGELAYEVSVPWALGRSLWDLIAEAGRSRGITPYGMEALHVLRAEKGYLIVGQETDGRTAPADVGLARMVAKSKDFVGKRSLATPEMLRPDRHQLVGFFPADPEAIVPEGAAIVADPEEAPPRTILGHVTASHRSAALGRTFGLAMVKGGFGRRKSILHVLADGRATPITVEDFVLYDPEGAKRDG